MTPPRPCPPPYELVKVNEVLTGRVKMKTEKVKKKIIEELFVEVEVTYQKKYFNRYNNRQSHMEFVNKTIWRKEEGDEIDDLILTSKMIAVY